MVVFLGCLVGVWGLAPIVPKKRSEKTHKSGLFRRVEGANFRFRSLCVLYLCFFIPLRGKKVA